MSKINGKSWIFEDSDEDSDSAAEYTYVQVLGPDEDPGEVADSDEDEDSPAAYSKLHLHIT